MPGGQYTNLKAQAEAMGLGGRWPEVARMYADVNMAFGDIVKVTPSSKVVGDLALYLLSHDLKLEDLENPTPDHPLNVPNSVIDMFLGSLGQPDGGWPPKLQNAVFGAAGKPMSGRPGEHCLPRISRNWRKKMEEETGATSRTDLLSYADVSGSLRQVCFGAYAIWRIGGPANAGPSSTASKSAKK